MQIYLVQMRVYNVVSTVDLFQLHEYLWVATSVILTIDIKSSAGIYEGSALKFELMMTLLWHVYTG